MSDHSVIISVHSTVQSEVVLSWWKVRRGHEDDVDEAIKGKPTVKTQLLTSRDVISGSVSSRSSGFA